LAKIYLNTKTPTRILFFKKAHVINLGIDDSPQTSIYVTRTLYLFILTVRNLTSFKDGLWFRH